MWFSTKRRQNAFLAAEKLIEPTIRGLDFFWEFFLFYFGNFFCFSVWLAFPCVFHWFSFILLTCLCFPSIFLGFHCFSIGFTSFSSFSVVFHRFSLVFLVFPLFCLHFLTFPSFCFVSLRFHWFDCIVIISLCVFTLVFSNVFLLLVFSMGFLFYTACS